MDFHRRRKFPVKAERKVAPLRSLPFTELWPSLLFRFDLLFSVKSEQGRALLKGFCNCSNKKKNLNFMVIPECLIGLRALMLSGSHPPKQNSSGPAAHFSTRTCFSHKNSFLWFFFDALINSYLNVIILRIEWAKIKAIHGATILKFGRIRYMLTPLTCYYSLSSCTFASILTSPLQALKRVSAVLQQLPLKGQSR